jgi:hypothetical protein
MDSTNTCPLYFIRESYQVTYNTKDPDDIYVNESLVNLLDSKCTHFEKQSTHLEEKAHVHKQQQRHRYLKWKDVEAAAANKYKDYGEGITYQDILKRFPELGKSDGQAQDVLRNYKNKGKLYTSHRTKPQQYFLSNEQAELAAFNYRKSTHSDPIGGTTFSTRQKPHLSLYSDRYASYHNKNDLVVGIPEEEEQELIAQNTIQAIQLASSGRIPTGMHNILIHLTLFPGTEQEAYHTRLADLQPSQKYNKAKFLETKIDGYLIQYYVYPNGKVIIHIPSTRKPFLILEEYATSQLISSAYTFFPDYFLPFVAQVRDYLQRRLCDNIQCKIVPPLQGPTSTWVLKHADLNWDVPTTPLNYKVFSSPIHIPQLNGIFLKVYRKMSLQHKTRLRVEDGVHKFNSPFTDSSSSLGPTIISAAKDAMQKLSLVSKEGEQRRDEPANNNDY